MYYTNQEHPVVDVTEIIIMINIIAIIVFMISIAKCNTILLRAIVAAQIIGYAINLLYACLEVTISYGKTDYIDVIKAIHSAEIVVESCTSIIYMIISIIVFLGAEKMLKSVDVNISISQIKVTASIILLIIAAGSDIGFALISYLSSIDVLGSIWGHVLSVISALLHISLYVFEVCSFAYIFYTSQKNGGVNSRAAMKLGFLVQVIHGIFIASHLLEFTTHYSSNMRVLCLLIRIISTYLSMEYLHGLQ